MALELKNVAKRVGADVHIHPTNLSFEPGSFNVLLGTTLAGKTTLMQMMAGLEKPTSGEVWFNGKNVTGIAVQKRNVSMVYQQFINYPNMSVFDNIASPLRVARLPGDEIRKRVGEMAEMMRISAMLERRPSELSGGQQQRTAMARALVKDSDLILLDEPLANLDFNCAKRCVMNCPGCLPSAIASWCTRQPSPLKPCCWAGRPPPCTRGDVVDFGPTARIYRHPSSLTSAMVFSEPPINLARAAIKSGRGDAERRRFMAGTQGTCRWCVYHRHSPGITCRRCAGLPPSVVIAGRVKVAELTGSESIIHFHAHDYPWVSLSHGVHPFDTGQDAKFYADHSKCFYFDSDGSLVEPASADQGCVTWPG